MKEAAETPQVPTHPPSGGDVPGFLSPLSGAGDETSQVGAMVLDSDGSVSSDVFNGYPKYMTPHDVVRKNFRKLREDRDWSHSTMAKQLTRVSHGNTVWNKERVKRLESGRYKNVTIGDLYTFCHVFEVALWDLVVPPAGEVVSYSSNLVDRDKSSELLFHIPEGDLGQADVSAAMREELKAQHLQRWNEQAEAAELTYKAQIAALMDLEYNELMYQMSRIENDENLGHGARKDPEPPELGIWAEGWENEPGRVVRVDDSSEMVRDAATDRDTESRRVLREIIRETLAEAGYFDERDREAD